MSLREKHRQLMTQSTLNDTLIENHKADKNEIAQSTTPTANKSEGMTPAPSPISFQSVGPPRPKTANAQPPTEADLKRKAYLAAAKERNDKTKQEFEDRVKGYFEKGLAIEQQKMNSSSKVKKSNKEKNAEAVENGLFLQQLKQIGIDVGKMSKASQAMKPPLDAEDMRPRPSTISGGGRPSLTAVLSESIPPHTATSTFMTSTGLETRIANIERAVTSIQQAVNEHDKKLDTSIQLQRQILAMLTQQSSGSGLGEVGKRRDGNRAHGQADSSSESNQQTADETSYAMRHGRRNRRF